MKKLIPAYRTANRPSIVLDPLSDPTWGLSANDFQTDNPKEFLSVMFKSRSCALVVDESAEAIGRYAGEMRVVATQSRHLGHKAHFVVQRAVDLDRTIRDQCTELYLFRVGHNDAKVLAEEWGFEELKNASNLRQGEFYKVTRFETPIKLNLFGEPQKTAENEIENNS